MDSQRHGGTSSSSCETRPGLICDPHTSGSTMLRDLRANARSELLIEVQRLEKEFQFDQNSVERLEINEVIENWSIRDHSKHHSPCSA